ncbi:MAG: hypothetical protein C4K58_01020 [Flavobacteriaceae bacterium]|nr:MAG: hypothetical protein C4K58_01020 [Flavobacteriaceae bacterium]
MSLLLETLQILDGKIPHLLLHQKRLNQSRKILFGCSDEISLSEVLKDHLPYEMGNYKCRICYGEKIEKIEFSHYSPKKIESFYLVDAPKIDYQFKYANREIFDSLLAYCPADEILILQNGYLSDVSFANLLFFDNSAWFTPKNPLLKGIQRQHLLENGKISELEIHQNDLKNFSEFKLINAMLPFEVAPSYTLDQIINL